MINDLQGDWVYVNRTNRIIHNYIGIEFDSTEFYTVSDHGRTKVGSYSLAGDSIIIDDGTRYKIISLTKDTLKLSENGEGTTYYNRNLDFNNDLTLDSIELNTGECFGECPEFQLTLNRNTQVIKFIPKRNCKAKEETTVTFTNEEWNKLDSLFKWTKIDDVDTTYSYSAIDDWAMNIIIHYNDKQVKVKGTEGSLPYRLQPLVNVLTKKLRERGFI